MSLSKLGYSGASSQIAFDVQNPLSEKQHPLLLPTVLDTIFPYLTFKDLKSSRLVCKAWAEVGIPFIGRKKLEPVKFSSITFEDFVTLKKEFLKFPQKVKIFQGFEIKWEEMNVMIWNNFLASFKPSQLAISEGNVRGPSTNFENLLRPVLTTLTHLSLDIILDSSYSFCSFTALLNNFAQLQPMGMALKILRLEIYAGEDHHFTRKEVDAMCRAFEVVFQSQSQTLEELELEFQCVVSSQRTKLIIKKIEFPVFPSIRKLTLDSDIREAITKNHFSIFAPFDFCVKFPQLVQLNILDATLRKMDEEVTFVLTRGHPLMKKLIVFDGEDYSNLEFDETIDISENLHLSFPCIEELRIQDTHLMNLKLGGTESSWVETLRTLDAQGFLKDFDFKHLKKLEFLHYKVNEDIYGFMKSEEIPITIIEMLLDHHRQLPLLKHLQLTYPITLTEEKMNKIMEGILEMLPEELRAILTLDSY